MSTKLPRVAASPRRQGVTEEMLPVVSHPVPRSQAAIDIGRVGCWTSLLDQSQPAASAISAELSSFGLAVRLASDTSARRGRLGDDMLEHQTSSPLLRPIMLAIRSPPTRLADAARGLGGRFLLGLGVSHAPMIDRVRKLLYVTPYSDMAAVPGGDARARPAPSAPQDEPDHRARRARPEHVAPRGRPCRRRPPVLLAGRAHRDPCEMNSAGELLAPELMVVSTTTSTGQPSRDVDQ